jgi:hypothetical protein
MVTLPKKACHDTSHKKMTKMRKRRSELTTDTSTYQQSALADSFLGVALDALLSDAVS